MTAIDYIELQQYWYKKRQAKLERMGYSVQYDLMSQLYICLDPNGKVLFTHDDEGTTWTFLINTLERKS